jgi:16S rRNA pseudouridine516 synthase
MPILRLDRMLSSQGIGSRKEIKQLLSKKNVTVNGKTVTNSAAKANTDTDIIKICGKQIIYREHVYIMMNKPSGVISASEDPNAETVIDLLPDEFRRPGLFPAGRLDRDTEGFLLITDDGVFAHNILSPKHHVEKEYFALIDGTLSQEQQKMFENGLDIGESEKTLPAKIKVDEIGENGLVGATVTIHEGKFHQIKRMFHALGREVVFLRRNAIGSLYLDESLSLGECRFLSQKDILKITQK